jgi:23S rRNA (cytidine1920-2'-O)/16S rRNA (cytidine1409-2'-O)-methyltransferase
MRLDAILVQKKYAASRERAKERVENGEVSVNGSVITKPAANVLFGDEIVVSGEGLKWVSRAGLKLEKAFEEWQLEVNNQVCLDIGASTGGFTQVLLEHGAQKVYALDVGHGQLHKKVREDARVVNMEGTHIKDVVKSSFAETISCVVIDVSFISLDHVLLKAYNILKKGGLLVALIKPQFEVGKNGTRKGVVVFAEQREHVVEKVVSLARDLGFTAHGTIESPIHGGDGNIEYLLCAEK